MAPEALIQGKFNKRIWGLTFRERSVLMREIKQFCRLSRGTVFLVEGSLHQLDSTPATTRYVIKEITSNTPGYDRRLKDKWPLLQEINHENVLQHFHAETRTQASIHKALILMEWCPLGSLADFFRNHGPQLSTLHKLATDTVKGVVYLHGEGIVHGNLKPSNVMVSLDTLDNLQAKIGDLDGLMEDTTSPEDVLEGLVYGSPERWKDRQEHGIIKGSPNIRTADDVWSLGCIAVYLASHSTFLFAEPNGKIFEIRRNLKKRTNHRDVTTNHLPDVQETNITDGSQESNALLRFLKSGGRLQIPNNLPYTVKAFIRKCLTEELTARPDAGKLLSDPWILADPTFRSIGGTEQQSHMIPLKSCNLMPRYVDDENEFIGASWSDNCSASCAVRMLAHFNAPRFSIADVERLVADSPRTINPGAPLDKKYCQLIQELLPEYGLNDLPILTFAAGLLDNPQFVATFTKHLYPIGAPFPDLVEWMNTFEDDYEYVVKTEATWANIQSELDNVRPVLVLFHSGRYSIRPLTENLRCFVPSIPADVPSVHMNIIHGYVGVTDDTRILFCTDADGVAYEWDYRQFFERWNWEFHDRRVDKILECAQVYKRSMVFRQRKFTKQEVFPSSNKFGSPLETAGFPSSSEQLWSLNMEGHSVTVHKVKQLSQLSRGIVYLVQGNLNDKARDLNTARYALKEIHYEETDQACQKLEKRWAILKKINHENVLRYLHVEIFSRTLLKSPHVIVLMEWCQMGNLAGLYGNSRPEWSTLHKLIKDMVTGVDHLHTVGIFHGDIKPENIFVSLDASDNLLAKIGDLDDFAPIDHGMTNRTNLNTEKLVGTLMYLSPERQLDDNDTDHSTKYIKRNADIWSLGCTFVYLVTYDIIWFVKPNGESLEVKKHSEGNNTNDNRQMEDVDYGQLKRFLKDGGKPWVPTSLPTELRTFIKSCLMEDPQQRPNAQKLLDDPYVRSSPEIRYIEGVRYQPCMIKLRANNLLPRQEPGENCFHEDNLHLNEAWSNSANCAVRFLAHFQAPRFRIADAEDLIFNKCPKALTPGKPLKQKYCDLIRKNMDELGLKEGFARDMVNMLLDDEDMQANFTKGLQAVGSPFPDLVEWLNGFEDDYEYVIKVNALWADIQAEIDAGRPVLVMCQSGSAKVVPHAKQLLQTDIIPDKVPALGVDIVHGYIGSTDDNRSLFCTSSKGIVHEQDYKNFLKHWDWKPLEGNIEKIFDCAEVYRRSMVYRRKKT